MHEIPLEAIQWTTTPTWPRRSPAIERSDYRALPMTDLLFTPAELDHAGEVIAAAARAVEALDAGTYGLCSICEASLAEEVLHRHPLAATCPDHGGPADAAAVVPSGH